jgi:ABC-type nickel/cobalt efflux system permease component RcnA
VRWLFYVAAIGVIGCSAAITALALYAPSEHTALRVLRYCSYGFALVVFGWTLIERRRRARNLKQHNKPEE